MWLWHPQRHLSFDIPLRIGPFRPYTDDSQFEREAERLTGEAADQIRKYRGLFVSADAVCGFYEGGHFQPGNWNTFHAAVAFGIAGDSSRSRQLFDLFTKASGLKPKWLQGAIADALILRNSLENIAAFRELMLERIFKSRSMLGLPDTNIHIG